MIKIRTALPEKPKTILSLSSSLGYPPSPDKMAQQVFRVLLKSATDQVWVAQEDDQLIAWIDVFIARRVASAPLCEIDDIIEQPEYHRKGLGRKMVQRAIKWAAIQNMPLRLRCNARREDVHQFYESTGLSSLKHQHVFEIRQ